jgi:hypothetical protein
MHRGVCHVAEPQLLKSEPYRLRGSGSHGFLAQAPADGETEMPEYPRAVGARRYRHHEI